MDFYCAKRRVVIEVDGQPHYTDEGQMHDSIRSDFLAQMGISVLRFENREIMENFSVVCHEIQRFLFSGD